MNHPNPFVPKGSLLEQQTRRRSRLKLGVFCVLAVSVTCLVAMLIQGCKRENPDAQNNPPVADTNPPVMDTNPPPVVDTNPPIPMPPIATTNPPLMQPPTPVPPVADMGGSEYVVVAGDTLGKIAKEHGVSLKALEAANPGVDPKKLKIKQKLVIPASTKSADVAPAAAPGMAPDAGGEAYVVKNNDTLSKIAKKYGVSVKALKAENNLTTDRINVGQKLKIPAKAEATPAPVPAPDTTAAPVPPPAAAPAPSVPAPAPAK